MNKIVQKHYPVEKLPEDLRAELGLAKTATVTIEVEKSKSRSDERAAAIAELLEHRKTLRPSEDDSVARVRQLRDEWD